MAKLMTFIMVTIGLMLLLNMAGIMTSTGYVLGLMGINIGNIQNFDSTSFRNVMYFAIGSLVAVSGIRIGLFGAPSTPTFAAAVAALPLAVFVGDLISIIVKANETGVNWVSYLIFLLITPFAFGYMVALFDWVRGID